MAPPTKSTHKHAGSGVVVILKNQHKLPSGVGSILQRHNATANPVFGTPDEFSKEHAHLAKFHRVHAEPEKFEQLVSDLNAHDEVDAAYIQPAGSPPVIFAPDDANRTRRLENPPVKTPNFVGEQGYLKPAANGGFGSLLAHAQPGGKGDDVNIIDCEWDWCLGHEDLKSRVDPKWVVGVSRVPDKLEDMDHGTAVIGVIKGDENDLGVTGMAPNTNMSVASLGNPTEYASCIIEAAKKLKPGDILLLEVHVPGPNWNGDSKSQFGFIPVEWWPANLAAIQFAVSRGVIVVEAAGNGEMNLDDPIYDSPLWGEFGSAWKNPLNPKNNSSGAILVGAGRAPTGTHGNAAAGPERSKCWFSNYGLRVDCQAWGEQVTSAGYGYLQGGPDPNRWYTNSFGGTSSASPIIVGVLASLQGILKKANKTPLTPSTALALLRNNGLPQEDAPAQTTPFNYPALPKTMRIGNRPDLVALIQKLLNRSKL